MNRKVLSYTVPIVFILLPFVLFAALFAGCATKGFKQRNMAGVSRYFDADKDTVWNAVIQSSEGIPIEMKNEAKEFLRTQWVKGWSSDKTTGLLLEGQWQERYRLMVNVIEEEGKTYVSVYAQIETKPPGGSQAYRWTRIPSDGKIEQVFLKKVENILDFL